MSKLGNLIQQGREVEAGSAPSQRAPGSSKLSRLIDAGRTGQSGAVTASAPILPKAGSSHRLLTGADGYGSHGLLTGAQAAELEKSEKPSSALESTLKQVLREQGEATAQREQLSGMGFLFSPGSMTEKAQRLKDAVQTEKALRPVASGLKNLYQAEQQQSTVNEAEHYRQKQEERAAEIARGAQGLTAEAAPQYEKAKTNRQQEAANRVKQLLNPDWLGERQYTDADAREDARLRTLTQNEREALLALAGAGEWEKAADYLDAMQRTMNARYQETASEATQEMFSSTIPGRIAGVAARVGSQFLTPLANLEAIRQGIDNKITGENAPIDPNADLMSGSHIAQDATAGVTEGMGPKTAWLVNTGLSVLENLARYPLGNLGDAIKGKAASALLNNASLGLMAAGASGSSVLENAQEGMSTDETLALAAAAGFAEFITEKVSLESLLTQLDKAGKSGLVDLLKRTGKQMLAEGSEEAASDYINLLADSLIRGDRSEMNQYIQSCMESGMSQKEAETAALVQYLVKSPALSALGGALSGGIMVAGGSAFGKASDLIDRRNSPARADAAINSAYEDMQRSGILSDGTQRRAETTAAIRQAQDYERTHQLFVPVDENGAVADQRLTPETDNARSVVEDGNGGFDGEAALVQDKRDTGAKGLLTGAQAMEMERKQSGGADEGLHIDERTYEDMGSRKVNAFQYDHPELHGYFVDAARGLLYDLDNTVKGERFPIKDRDGSITGYSGTKRSTSETVARALDNAGITYSQLRKAVNDLIADHGQENYAAAKKVELILDDMLTQGYTTIDGEYVDPVAEYIEAKGRIRSGQAEEDSSFHMSEEEWSSLMEQESVTGPRELPTGAEALQQAGGHDTIEEIAAPLTEEERGAILRYKSGESYQVNAKIRDGAVLNETEQRFVDELDSALTKLPEYTGVVYRHLNFDLVGEEALTAFVAEHREGDYVVYPSYTSTSKTIDGYGADGTFTAQIEIFGTSGRDISGGFGITSEQEVLYPRNAWFVVKSAAFDGKTARIVLEESNYGKGYDERGTESGHRGDTSGEPGSPDFKKRGEGVQPVQEQHPGDVHLQGISQRDTAGDSDGAQSRHALPGGQRDSVRADGVTSGPRGLLTGAEAYELEQGAGKTLPDGDAATIRWAGEQMEKLRAQKDEGTEYIGTPATDKLGIKIHRPITELGASQSLRAIEKARYEANRDLNSLLKRSGATEAELYMAKGVAQGTLSLDGLLPGGNRNLIQEIADAIQLRDSFQEKALQAQKEQTNWVFDEKVRQLIKNSDEKKTPGAVSLNANTMQRNNERVWGSDAKGINEELFDPVIVNEGERIRFVNRMLSQMEAYHLTQEESALVQKLMEEETTAEKVKADGYDADRLTSAAKTLSGLYSDFYDAINDFLVAHGYREIGFQKNYAPHMQEEQTGTLQKYLQRMGFQAQVTELPTDLAGRTDTFRPGKQYNPYFQHRVGDKTAYDAVGGFESYVNYLSNVLYHTDDIQKLRRFSEALRIKYSSAELAAELDRLNYLQDRTVDDDTALAGYDSIQDAKEAAFKRYGNMSRFGTYVSVLDDYTNILAGKQSKFDRAVESLFGRKMLNAGRNIQNAFSKAAIMGNLSSAINQTVQLPQLMAEVGPRFTVQAVYDVATGTTAKDGMNQESDFLTGKTGIQSISEKTRGERFFDLAAKPFEVVDDFASRVIVRAKYLQQVAEGKGHAEALQASDQFANRLVGSRMKGAKPVLFEQKNPLSKLVTTFQLEVANGWAHLTQDLPGEIRQIAQTKGKPAAVKRTAELVVASQLINFIANLIIKGITGREPVPFDGLGTMANVMASGYGMTKEEYMSALMDGAAEGMTGKRPLGTSSTKEKFDLAGALKTGAEDIAEDLPYVSNITALAGLTDNRLPLPQVMNTQLKKGFGNLAKAVSAEDPEEKQEALEQGLMGVLHGLGLAGATWVPMGSQLKKSVQGITALTRGGAYTGYGDDEKLQYAVEQSPANMVRGALFGKSALPETDAYYAHGSSPLTEKQTEAYERLLKSGMKNTEAYELLQKLRTVEKTESKSKAVRQMELLQVAKLDDDQKMIVYRAMISDKNSGEIRAVTDAGLDFNSFLSAKRAGISFEVFSSLTAEGVSGKTALKMARALTELKPEFGTKQVTSLQKFRAVVDTEATKEEKVHALAALAGETESEKIVVAWKSEVPPEVYVTYREQITAIDDNGSVSQKEAQRALNGMLITTEQKAILWQLQNLSWKASSNPFSVAVGRRVLQSYQNSHGIMGWLPTGKEAAEFGNGKNGGLPLPK